MWMSKLQHARVCVTHHWSLSGTAHMEAPSLLQACCCSSIWPWWCWRHWAQSIFLPRIWWNRSSLWYLPKKVSKFKPLWFSVVKVDLIVHGTRILFSVEIKSCQYATFISMSSVALMLTSNIPHRSSCAWCQRVRSPVGMSTGSCRGCWCRCQTGSCWAPPHTHRYLLRKSKRTDSYWLPDVWV